VHLVGFIVRIRGQYILFSSAVNLLVYQIYEAYLLNCQYFALTQIKFQFGLRCDRFRRTLNNDRVGHGALHHFMCSDRYGWSASNIYFNELNEFSWRCNFIKVSVHTSPISEWPEIKCSSNMSSQRKWKLRIWTQKCVFHFARLLNGLAGE
jgi:hypothetical protein